MVSNGRAYGHVLHRDFIHNKIDLKYTLQIYVAGTLYR